MENENIEDSGDEDYGTQINEDSQPKVNMSEYFDEKQQLSQAEQVAGKTEQKNESVLENKIKENEKQDNKQLYRQIEEKVSIGFLFILLDTWKTQKDKIPQPQ